MILTLDHDGKRYAGWRRDQLVAAGVPQTTVDAASLAQAQADAVYGIETAAGAARSRFITTTPGQAQVYALKLAEALAYQAAGAPAAKAVDAAHTYPLLSAQAAFASETIAAAATAVVTAHTNWVAAAAKIEAIRVTSRRAVRSAETPDEASGAAAAAVSALAQV
jgi:hypothetical protein